jgi:NAD(P)-dependent dehydrogenase (short-subunit alcohol dehydrogenase family)
MTRTALVTGGGRGIGADIARALSSDGWDVIVTARSRSEIDAVAQETGGRAIELDVSDRGSVERAFAEAGPIGLLVNNAGISGLKARAWEQPVEDWWRVFEVNVLGTYLCCRAAIPGMVERGGGRIINLSSGASYHPDGAVNTPYTASKAALNRFGEVLHGESGALGIPVFTISPGMVLTDMSRGWFPEDTPWTPREAAPTLVLKLASGRYDALAGRYLHAEHDDVDDLLARIDDVRARDLNAIRLRG